MPPIKKLIQILRMNGGLPSPAAGFSRTKAGVLTPALVQKVDMTVWKRSPNQAGERIENAA